MTDTALALAPQTLPSAEAGPPRPPAAPAPRRREGDPAGPQLSKAEKAAVILLALGPEAAATLLGNLGDQQVRNFAHVVNNLPEVPAPAVDRVIGEFLTRLADTTAVEGGRAEAKRFLKQALGAEEVNRIVGDLEGAERTVWSLLGDVQGPALAVWLKGEHPQVAAIVLSQLAPAKAAQVLERFDPHASREIVMRMGAATSADPRVTDRIAEAIARDFLPMAKMRQSRLNPADLIADVMNHVSSGVRDELMAAMSSAAPGLAKAVAKVMFTFDHITERVSPRDVGLVIKAVDEQALFRALKGEEERQRRTREFIFGNISKRLAGRMAEDLEALDPPTPREREAAQAELVAAITDLRDSGALKLIEPDGGDG